MRTFIDAFDFREGSELRDRWLRHGFDTPVRRNDWWSERLGKPFSSSTIMRSAQTGRTELDDFDEGRQAILDKCPGFDPDDLARAHSGLVQGPGCRIRPARAAGHGWPRQRERIEVIRRRGPSHHIDVVEFAVLEWVDWFNHRRPARAHRQNPTRRARGPLLPSEPGRRSAGSQPRRRSASGDPGAVHRIGVQLPVELASVGLCEFALVADGVSWPVAGHTDILRGLPH